MLCPVRLTALHKPEVEHEHQRLTEAGHAIADDTVTIPTPTTLIVTARTNQVSAMDGEEVHMLRMSRCIGDHQFKVP